MLWDIHTVVLNERHDTTIELQVPSHPLMVHADPTRLEQIIWNPVNNALKFTPPTGHVQLVASKAGNMVRLDVKDNGTGSPPRILSTWLICLDKPKNSMPLTTVKDLGLGCRWSAN